MSEEIFLKVKKAIRECWGTRDEEIKLDTNLINDLAADSIDLVELLMDLEETFEREVPDEDADRLLTVQDIVNYFQAREQKVIA